MRQSQCIWNLLVVFFLIQGSSSWQPSSFALLSPAGKKVRPAAVYRWNRRARIVHGRWLHAYPNDSDWSSSYDESDPVEIVQPPTREERLAMRQQLQMEEKNEQPQPRELRLGPLGSLEVLAIVVALFFAVTVFAVGGDTLFVTGTSAAIPSTVNADEILRQDFVRMETSVAF